MHLNIKDHSVETTLPRSSYGKKEKVLMKSTQNNDEQQYSSYCDKLIAEFM